MITNGMGIAIFRANHRYQLCGLTDQEGIVIRLLMYLVSFIVIYTFLALMPDIKLPLTYIGRHTMGIYLFHYPIMIIMNGLYLLRLPQLTNVWALLGVSLVFILVLGSLPVDWLYTGVINIIAFILFKTDKTVRDEGLEEEYDSDENKYEILRQRRKAIEELAATLEPDKDHVGSADPEVEGTQETTEKNEGSSRVAGYEMDIEEDNLDDVSEEPLKEEERELTLEELMEELEAATRKAENSNLQKREKTGQYPADDQ